MTGTTFLSGLLLLLVVAAVVMVLRIVPQGEEWLVERLGKYRTTLIPGLRVMIPFVDRVASRVTTKDILLEVPEQEIVSRDKASVLVSAIAVINVADPLRAVYGVQDYQEALRSLIVTELSTVIGEMEIDQALTSRDKIKMRLKGHVAEEAAAWGLSIKSIEVQDIRPSAAMLRALELEASAERERKAVLVRAEGEKEVAILAADARLEAARRDAGTQIILAEASAQAIAKVARACGNSEQATAYLLGERYIASLERLAASENGKTVVLPGDIQAALKGVFGQAGNG